MKMSKYLWISVLFLLGCAQQVGGPCTYKTLKGTALVKEKNEAGCKVDFYPEQRVWAEWNVEKELMGVEAICMPGVSTGKKYAAVYKKCVKGTCTPYFLSVYTDKQYEYMKKQGMLK